MTMIQSVSGFHAGTAFARAADGPSTELIGGQAVFSNENFVVATADDGSLSVHDKGNDKHLVLSGSPVLGGHAGVDFHGASAFVLRDGTVLRLESLPGCEGPVAKNLTIVDGDYSVAISNIASTTKLPTIVERPLGQARSGSYHENISPWIGVDAGGYDTHVDPLFVNAPQGCSPLGPPPIGATSSLLMGKTQAIALLPPATAAEKEPSDLERAIAALRAQFEEQLRANPELKSVYVSGTFYVDGRPLGIKIAVDNDDDEDPNDDTAIHATAFSDDGDEPGFGELSRFGLPFHRHLGYPAGAGA